MDKSDLNSQIFSTVIFASEINQYKESTIFYSETLLHCIKIVFYICKQYSIIKLLYIKVVTLKINFFEISIKNLSKKKYMHNMYEKMKMLNKYDNKDNEPMKKDSNLIEYTLMIFVLFIAVFEYIMIRNSHLQFL